MKITKVLAICCLLLLNTFTLTIAFAQGTPEQEVEMADILRSDGKIYVVVTVLLTVLIGLILYLVSLDKKVSKLEKQVKNDLLNR